MTIFTLARQFAECRCQQASDGLENWGFSHE